MRKSTVDEVKEAWEQIKEERARYYKERELKKQGINPRDNEEYEIKERGVREVSTDAGDVERTVTSHSPTNETAAYRSQQEGTYIFGKKYVKGDKSSRIRLILLLAIVAAVVAFFVIMGILGSQQ